MRVAFHVRHIYGLHQEMKERMAVTECIDFRGLPIPLLYRSRTRGAPFEFEWNCHPCDAGNGSLPELLPYISCYHEQGWLYQASAPSVYS